MNPTWKIKTVRLSDLVPWTRNPRRIPPKQAERLIESYEEFGQVETIAIGPNNEVYNGHQRLKVLAERFGLDYEIDARVSSRELSEKEREKLTIYLHRGAAGEFDLEILLKEFDKTELVEWGMPEFGVADNPEDEWQDMPEFDGSSKSKLQLTVLFKDNDAIASFSELIGQEINEKTKSIWYPKKEKDDLHSEGWKSES